ncbi:sulfate adenylyltransferase subunit CysD [Desertibaculum subflavum]|uniref:sulfate adenylyltransferase subunit CysD n=1 Tax=Desertibaculum subflavum TaxID=2268458 RepID=UPI000E675379
MLDHLDALEGRTIYILREAFCRVAPLALLWSVGKDSNALLWMCRKAFFGRVPFPVVQLDTGMELDEVYRFRDSAADAWSLDLRIEACPPEGAVDPALPPAARAAARKTAGLRSLIGREGYRGVLLGIRRDEQAVRAKERVFSPRGPEGGWAFRDQPPEFWDQYKTEVPEAAHLRIHPLLDWSELDIWRYTRREGIPVVPPYLARDGRRYRSLGERNITHPIASTAATIDEIIAELEATRVPERAGRAMDHEAEDAFERLRADGYM